MSTVQAFGYRHTEDIDLDAQKSASKWESLATVCISRARDALSRPTGTYTKVHRDTISDLLRAMLVTQGSIGKLLEGGSESPQSVDALALLQLEGLFATCLLTESSSWVDVYLGDAWKKQFIRHLLFHYETEYLPRFPPDTFTPELARLVKFMEICGVSVAQMQTLGHEQLGVPMPKGTVPAAIPRFPTPGGVIANLGAGAKRRMLERFHMDYVYLCSFAHGLQAANMAKSVYDYRSTERRMFSEGEVERKFQFEVNTNARCYSFLSIAQAVAELIALYPNDMDLTAAVSAAWHDLVGSTFFVNAVWNRRTKDMLGVIG
jgi:hypothetical protein